MDARPDDLLRTKLAPPRLGRDLLPRPALVARLDAGLARKVTLVAAPAGWGKSTLVAGWLAGRPKTAAWVALDAGDNDPVRFWRYVVSALRACEPALGGAALDLLSAGQIPSFDRLLTALVNELAGLPHQLILVLEDYQMITSPEVHGTLAFLVEHLPATLHLVLITRREPDLPLARWRARDELNELRAADLQFNPGETQAFLRKSLGQDLPARLAARLAGRTEGWPAGLRLAGLALAGRTSAQEIADYLAGFGGGERRVLDYLSGEVLAAQPADVQGFLLATSFLPRLTGGLCDAITDRSDGAAVLEELARANLFLIPLASEGERPWYRYHALFAEALQHAARYRLHEAAVKDIHGRAGRWYEAHGLLNEAIEAALAAGEPARAAALIERVLEPWGFAEAYTMRRWAEQLPSEALAAHPAVGFAYAQAVLFTNDRYAPATAAAVERVLQDVEQAWRAAGDAPGLGKVLALRAIITLWQGDMAGAVATSRASLELLPAGQAMWRGSSLSTVATGELLAGRIGEAQRLALEAYRQAQVAGNIHILLVATQIRGEVAVQQGDLGQAVEHYRELLAGAVGGEEMLDDQCIARLGLAAIAYERDELDAAAEQAGRAAQLAGQRHDAAGYLHAGLLLARVELARGQASAAQARLRELAVHTHRPALLRELGAWQATLALAAGDLTRAGQYAASLAAPEAGLPRLQQEHEALVLARLRTAQANASNAVKAASAAQETLSMLQPWQAEAAAQGRVRSEIAILCQQALTHAALGDAAQAEEALARALALGRPNDLRRIFLDAGPLAPLLQGLASQHGYATPDLPAYAAGLLRAATTHPPAGAPTTAPTLIEPLSAQEQRVLRLLAAGLSNPEIARELVVSINTIKTQVRSIYRKLGVEDRAMAAAAARDLNLL